MTDVSMAAFAAYQFAAATPAAPAPTAAQIQRFQDQLQQPLEAAHYDAPLPAAAATEGNFAKLLDYAARVSDGLRAKLDRPDQFTFDPRFSPEAHFMQEMFREMRAASLLEVQFRLLGKGMQMATRNVQTLYQQQG